MSPSDLISAHWFPVVFARSVGFFFWYGLFARRTHSDIKFYGQSFPATEKNVSCYLEL